MTEERSRQRPSTRDGRDAASADETVDADLLSAIADGGSTGILVLDGRRVAFANAAAADLLGRTADDLAGSSIAEAVPKSAVDCIESVAETEAQAEREWTGPVARPAGETVSISLTCRDDSRGYVVVTAERARRADGDSRVPEREYRHLVENAAETALALLGPQGEIRFWNSAAESETGWDATEAVGNHVSALYPDSLAEGGRPQADVETARRTGSLSAERRCVRPDGSTFRASLSLEPLPTDEGVADGFTLELRDVTDRERARAERQLLAEISRGVAQADTFTDGVETALAAVCAHTEWAYGEAWIPTADGQSLAQAAGHAERPELEPFLDASQSVTFQFGEGLPGRVWESESCEWIPDASAQPSSVFHRTDLAAEVGLRAALGVPITTDDRVVAVLTFFLQERHDSDAELVEVVSDVAADLGRLMERKRTQDALDRERGLLRRIFTASPVGLLVTDETGTVIRANRQAGDIFDSSTAELSGRRFGQLLDVNDEDAVTPDPVAEVLEETMSVDSVELRLSQGEESWVSIHATPMMADDGGIERVVVAMEDVTEQKEREQSLRTFKKAVEHAGHSIYVTDVDGSIEYVNPTFEKTTGYSAAEAIGRTPSILNSGEHEDAFYADLWETILDGEVWTGEVVNQRKSGQRYEISQTVTPIVDESGAIERFVAVNDEITERKRRERTLRRQRNTLERIKQIIESLRPINRQLARAGTREDIDRLVCERLASAEAYLFSWIGDYNSATGAVTIRDTAGVETEFVADVEAVIADSSGDGNLFERAISEMEVQAVQRLTTDPSHQARRERAIEYGYQSMAAVPVVYGETVFGVIGVYSARQDAFDSYERGLLRELGERIGHAINAAENKQLLHTDRVVELEFAVGTEDSAFTAAAERHDCELSLNNVTPTTGRGYLCYLEVTGVAPERLVASVEERSDVESARVVQSHGETGVVEVAVRAGPVVTLVEHGATLRSFRVTDREATLVGETRPKADVEAMISDMEGAHEGTKFMAKRTLNRSGPTMRMTRNAVADALTDRQREVLSLAYHAGYFKSPRDSTGEDLASALGISSPTFYRHTRKGIQRLLELIIEAEELSPRPD